MTHKKHPSTGELMDEKSKQSESSTLGAKIIQFLNKDNMRLVNEPR
jgi:hypothetical protein